MPKGIKYGGRKKGTPNKLTVESREVFKAMFDRLAPDVEKYIRQTAEGIEKPVIRNGEPLVSSKGKLYMYRAGGDPAKAADLTLRLAEFHLPKLARSEVVGEDGGPVRVVEIVREDT